MRELCVGELAGLLLRAEGPARCDRRKAEGVPPLAEVGQSATSQAKSQGCEEERCALHALPELHLLGFYTGH